MGTSIRWNWPRIILRMTSEFRGVASLRLVGLTPRSHFTHPTIQPANLLIDAVSLGLVNGSTIDFATELIGSSFRVDNNPQAKGSGCGCGVSWELKD
jgi:hypothetical protein